LTFDHIVFQIADSFQSNDPFAQAAASQQVQQTQNVMPLQKPPKWLRKPVGATFGVYKINDFFHEVVSVPVFWFVSIWERSHLYLLVLNMAEILLDRCKAMINQSIICIRCF
jgi:hypothetical protein